MRKGCLSLPRTTYAHSPTIFPSVAPPRPRHGLCASLINSAGEFLPVSLVHRSLPASLYDFSKEEAFGWNARGCLKPKEACSMLQPCRHASHMCTGSFSGGFRELLGSSGRTLIRASYSLRLSVTLIGLTSETKLRIGLSAPCGLSLAVLKDKSSLSHSMFPCTCLNLCNLGRCFESWLMLHRWHARVPDAWVSTRHGTGMGRCQARRRCE